ncbi:MAG: hypothetical protein ACK4PK_05700 [Alphaproteobacteria bacterium]
MGINVYKKSTTILFFALALLPEPAAADLGHIPLLRRARPVDYEGVQSEAKTFAAIAFINLALFFFAWLCAKKAAIKPAPDTRIKSIYFNCSHTAAERWATGMFLFCFSSLAALLFLSRQTCPYTQIPLQPSLLELFAFTGIITIPVCLFGGLRSVYLYFRFPQEIKQSPADKRHCTQSLFFYLLSFYIFYHTFLSRLCA